MFTREDSKCVSMATGEVCVRMAGLPLMHRLSAPYWTLTANVNMYTDYCGFYVLIANLWCACG